MNSPEPPSQWLQQRHPQSLSGTTDRQQHTSRLLLFSSLPWKASGHPGEGIHPSISPNTGCKGTPGTEPRSAVGQLELCHATNAKLSKAAPAKDIFETWVHYPLRGYFEAVLVSKLCESTQGPVPGDSQTFRCVTAVFSAEKASKPTRKKQQRKASRTILR